MLTQLRLSSCKQNVEQGTIYTKHLMELKQVSKTVQLYTIEEQDEENEGAHRPRTAQTVQL